MEISEEMKADLLRFMNEYGWEPRITSKVLNRRYQTKLTAEDVSALYAKNCTKEVDPVQHLLNLEERFLPSAYKRKTLIE